MRLTGSRMPADSEDFRLGVQHIRAGRLAEAEAVFRQLLAAAPDDPDVLHLLGLTLHNAARHEEALVLLTRALPLRRQQPELHNNIGTVLAALHREPEAGKAEKVTSIISVTSAAGFWHSGLWHPKQYPDCHLGRSII